MIVPSKPWIELSVASPSIGQKPTRSATSDPAFAMPVRLKQIPLSGLITGVGFYKNATFFSSGSEKAYNGSQKVLYGVDVTNPEDSTTTIKYPYVYNSNWDVVVKDDHVYLLDNSSVLSIIKIIED